jgi:signal transduction histidine kinase
MHRTAGTLGLAQRLARRLLPLTLAMGVLLSAGIPATYYIIDARSLEHTATIYAEELAERLGEFVFTTPTLWKYQAEKYVQLLQQFVGHKALISIQILDEAGRPISNYTHITAKAEAWWNRDAPRGTAPILFNNRQVGQVEVRVARDAELRTTVVLLIGATVIGMLLARLVYRFPVRVVSAMEADLARAYSGLEKANTQLTAEIAERRRVEVELKVHMDQLERSNHELQDFAYVASHDLQEPLRKIRTFGDRLTAQCAEALGDRGRDYLARMQQAAARMQTLIEDLLTFSRVTTKAQPFRSVDLTRVAHEVVDDLEVRLEQSGGRVVVEALPAIEADPLQMRQLLQNLLGNALKFHRPDVPPVVTVRSRRSPGEAAGADGIVATPERCELLVEDNGIGFDEKYLDRIFAPFQRLHGRGEYEGTGIGLAVCRKIAERHGGRITATSTPGQGATFSVTLPVSQLKGENLS